jgi:thiol:disulfide interchange protein DsbD
MRFFLLCLLPSASLALAGGTAHAQGGVPGGADSVSVSATAQPAVVTPGATVTIAVTLSHARGFHTWPNEPIVPPEFEGVNAIATAIEVLALPEGAVEKGIEWPEPVPVTVRYTRKAVELLSYVGDATARLRVELAQDQPAGQAEVALEVRYQACDERVCYPPRTAELMVSFEVEAG